YVDYAALLESACAELPPALRHRIMLGRSSPAGYVDRAGFAAAASRTSEDELEEGMRVVSVREEAVMMYTSGTTANPKGCPFAHEAIMRAAIAIVDRFALTTDDRFWDPLPFYHLAGLELFLSNLWAGS